MNKMDNNGLFLCNFTSNLFEYSTAVRECSSKTFIKAYVYSSISKITSDKAFILESFDIPKAYEIIKKEKKLTRGKDIYPSYVMAWIGFIMKYISYTTGYSEAFIYKMIKPEELYRLYEAYHSLDNDMVVRRIMEAKGINLNMNNIDVIRQVYKKNK